MSALNCSQRAVWALISELGPSGNLQFHVGMQCCIHHKAYVPHT
jgi:hypothetical protein